MLSNATVGKKIAALTICLVALTLILGTISVVGVRTMSQRVATLTGDTLPGVEAVGLASAKLYRFRGDAWKHMAITAPDQLERMDDEMSQLRADFDKQMAAYEARIHQDEDAANFRELRQQAQDFFRTWGGVAEVSRKGPKQQAVAQYQAEVDPIFQRVKDTLIRMQKWNSANGAKTSRAAEESATRVQAWTWMLLAGCVVFGALVSGWITHGLNGALREIAVELNSGASRVAQASRQVAEASQSLAQDASDQAASLEEISASSEEINSMARRSSDNSNQMAKLVASSEHEFDVARQSLHQMVAAMDGINTQSDRISRIIQVIDEIAFQTNILALNAAVEAARAGDSGMGFAVVADEVRNLAQRSAQAAKDTAGLIEESITKSSDGKVKVDQLAGVMERLLGELGTMKTLVDEVATGSREQESGIGQIAKGISRMERVVQQSAASAEESASAAEEMSSQSDAVASLMGRLTAMVGSA
ncbi:MAG: MCP four helix bundle domain-containing protein [Acidobacteria bacterium]|nr:MCP four helix bundle domain-containing protein [Acidobacteriota bacterium]